MISMVAGTPNERAIVTRKLTVRATAVKSHPAYATCLILCIPRPRSHCMPLKNLDLHSVTWHATIYTWGLLYSLHFVICRIHRKSNVWTQWRSLRTRYWGGQQENIYDLGSGEGGHYKNSLMERKRYLDFNILLFRVTLNRGKNNESIVNRVSPKYNPESREVSSQQCQCQ